MMRLALLAVGITCTLAWAAPGAPQASEVSAADVAAALPKLGSFDLPVRIEAARTVRRAPSTIAVPALTRAALDHADGYVRYRALVLLAGFGDNAAGPTMRQVMADRNDRLRNVAYEWFEQHKDPAVVTVLVAALDKEQSEFVRPALMRALVAHSDDPRARAAVTPLVMRGEDDFRGVIIEALGEHRSVFAVENILEVAKLDGPLQDDAVAALGKIGDARARPVLIDLQRNGPRGAQPAVAAGLCLLGISCETNEDYLTKSLTFGVTNAGFQPLLRSAASALAVLGARGNTRALTALFETGGPSRDPARAPIALAVGAVALRNPAVVLDVLEERKPAERDAAILLLRDAFDMLASEDYRLERFFVEVRRAYWAAAAGSPRRQLAELLIQKLEF